MPFKLIISNELYDILYAIRQESEIADLLIKCGQFCDDDIDLVDSPVNYISIANDKSKISYLTAERLSRIDISDVWSTSKRFAGRPGSVISKIFKNASSREIEKFVNLYNSIIDNSDNFKFKVVDGSSIAKYYHYNSYYSESGTLGSSCMKHEHCNGFFNIYSRNSNIIKMLVMTNDQDLVIGRALLWHFNENKIMDRIYTVSDEKFQFHFKKWATDQGYLYKSEQNWFDTLNFENLSTSRVELKLEVQLDNWLFNKYPYLDTFKFLNKKTGIIRNFINSDTCFTTLCSADGSELDFDFLVFDGIDKILRHRGDSVYLKYLDIHTYYDNAKYSEINDEYILRKDCIYNDELHDFIYNEEFNKYNKSDLIENKLQEIRSTGCKKECVSSFSKYYSLIAASMWSVTDEADEEDITNIDII